MKKPVQVFLSYSRQDEDSVKNLYRKLQNAGLKPWMDQEDILPGENWELSTYNAIRNSDFFLVCLSKNSVNKRGYIQREIKYALNRWQEKLDDDIYLIPVRLEDCEIPEGLKKFHWVNLFEKDGWSRLLRALETGIERQQKNSERSEYDLPSKKKFPNKTSKAKTGYTFLFIIVFFLYISSLFIAIPYVHEHAFLYGTAIVYLAFGIFSLIAATIFFGFFKSTPIVKNKQYKFGGAVALFVVMFTLLISNFEPPMQPKEVSFSGIVYMDNKPLNDAKVNILGIEKSAITNQFGKFEIKVSENDVREKYDFHISYEQIDTTITINNDDKGRGLQFRLKRPLENVRMASSTSSSLLSKPTVLKSQAKSHQVIINAPKDALILVDGKTVGSSSVELKLVEGIHTISVQIDSLIWESPKQIDSDKFFNIRLSEMKIKK